jgi:hypothetical protein
MTCVSKAGCIEGEQIQTVACDAKTNLTPVLASEGRLESMCRLISVQAPQVPSAATTIEDSVEVEQVPFPVRHPPLQRFSTWRVPRPVIHR